MPKTITNQKLVNKVQAWCDKNKMDRQDFLATVLGAKVKDEGGRTLSVDTILRVYDGDTKISLATASMIAQSLVGVVSMSELFDIDG